MTAKRYFEHVTGNLERLELFVEQNKRRTEALNDPRSLDAHRKELVISRCEKENRLFSKMRNGISKQLSSQISGLTDENARQILKLRYLDRLSLEEVGRIIDRSTKTVQRHQTDALQLFEDTYIQGKTVTELKKMMLGK